MTVIFLKFIISVKGLFAWSPKSLAMPLFYTTGIGKTWTIFRILIWGPFRKEPFWKKEGNTHTRLRKQILRNQVTRMWTWIIWFRIKLIENLFPFVPSTALLLLNRVDGWTKLIAFMQQVYKFLISVSISYSDTSHGFSRSAYKNTAVMSQNEISISWFLNFFSPFSGHYIVSGLIHGPPANKALWGTVTYFYNQYRVIA